MTYKERLAELFDVCNLKANDYLTELKKNGQGDEAKLTALQAKWEEADDVCTAFLETIKSNKIREDDILPD